MSLDALDAEELKSILVATGVDPAHGAAQDPERVRTILGLLAAAELLGIEVTATAIRLFLPAQRGSGRSLVLPRRRVVH